MDWMQIYEGWRNKLFPPEDLKGLIKQVSEQRLAICRGCSYNSINRGKHSIRFDEHCTECGCPLDAKTKCLSCSCGLTPPKWENVLTEEQEAEINTNEQEGSQ